MSQPRNTPPHALVWRLLAFIAAIAFSTPSVGDTVVVPDDHESIADALAAVAGTTDATVIVEPGTYREAFSIPNDVVLRGRETARTFLRGTGEGAVVTAAGTQGSRISNFTFTGAEGGPAILVDGGSNLIITNNVFALGVEGTAIQVQAASPSIEHNVFFENGTAVDTGGNGLTIRNNAFVGNGVTLTPDPVDESAISHNGFFDNDTATTFGTNAVTGSPLFVATGARDFHLRAGSPYIDAGTGADDVLDNSTADIGVYGGERAEGIPFPVGRPTVATTTDTTISLHWPANAWYRVGGYRLYYDSDRSGPPYTGTDADGGSSPIDVGNVMEYTLEGLTPPTPPAAPVLAQPEPLNGALKLAWSAVPSAAGYVVHYGVASPDEHSIDVGNVTGYTLSGLENGTTYRITVSAYATASYFLAVSAYANFGDQPESALSPEVSTTIGGPISGPASNEISDFPEAIVPFPNLPDKNGCFIATAAYGHYSAGEVQLLRAFRDRYLLTHAPGRAFVAWYYRHSPRWAQAIETHTWAKPAVRLALLPAIGIAGFALNTPATVQVALALCLFSLLLLTGRRLRDREDMSRQQHIGFVLLLLVTQGVPAAETANWSFEFKGGRFESAEEQWSDFYGDDRFSAYALGLGYKVFRQFEVGVEAGYLSDQGQGLAPGHGVLAGNVKYRLYPAHVQLTLRGIFHPDQWLVPYVGAGLSRLSYRIETDRQSDISGTTDGYQYRAGLQLLLDNLDPSAAADLASAGIANTYFFLEAQRTEARLAGTELGGTAFLGGFRFEF